jgi:hypothetical protein
MRLMMVAVAVVAVALGILRAWWQARQQQEALQRIRLAIKQNLVQQIGQAQSAEQWVSGRPVLPGNKNRLSNEELQKELQKIEAELALIKKSLRETHGDQN